MFLPIGDHPSPTGYPTYVTWALIGLNVAIYALVSLPLSTTGVTRDPALMEYLRIIAPRAGSLSLQQVLAHTSAYDLFVFEHGYKPGAPEVGDLFAAMFLHSGFAHLGGNMLFLWIYGRNVEHRIGRGAFLVTYLVTGVAATLAFAVFAGDSLLPLVGASGAISGVLGLYFLMFPRNKVKMLIALFPFFFQVIHLPARLVLGFYVLVTNLLPLLSGSDSNVAYGAHLGGFIAGLGAAAIGERWQWSWPWQSRIRSPPPASAGVRRDPARAPLDPGASLDALHHAIAAGHTDRAIQLAVELPPREVSRIGGDDCVVLARWLGQRGYRVAALTLLRRWLSVHPRAPDHEQARVHLDLGLVLLANAQATAAAQHFLAALDLDPDPRTAQRAREALASLGWR